MDNWEQLEVLDSYQSEKLKRYLQYLTDYNPVRLEQEAVLINDLRALLWRYFEKIHPGKLPSRNNLESILEKALDGCKFATSLDVLIPDHQDICDDWNRQNDTIVCDYIKYLLEYNPARLDDWGRFIEDIEILTWEIFIGFRHRRPTPKELAYMLKSSLVLMDTDEKITHIHSLKAFVKR